MLKGAPLALLAVLLSTAAHAEDLHLYAVSWSGDAQRSVATRAILEQADAQLRAELARRGNRVVNAGEPTANAIVLMPTLEVDSNGTTISMVKVGADRSLLGSVKAKVGGPHRDAKLRRLIQRAVDEVARL